MGWTLTTKTPMPIGTDDAYLSITYINWSQIDSIIRDMICNGEDLAGITIHYKP